ncbi:Vps54 domain-containing protein [Mycena indigotica]|uniref:Vps54 domain-containing protein n=1 Tax=Mycena indigotica TaxID=2126181 RepID=A0A8H6S9E4_9AGAR|nr:Vps54 domain-containing protein [Mycena indigotica]KAF7295401.1 Vps54 domain-containing protein [Mycena indigotica]
MSEESSSNPSRPASPVSPLPPTARPFRFNWDPNQRGPESVSGTTEGRDYFAGPSRLNLFNTSTANLGLSSLPQQWSSTTHGFHAISTVLNNPHKKQAPPKAHSSLPAVAPAELPRVRRKDFDSYLRAIAPEWERLEHSHQLSREAELQLEGSSTPKPTNGPFTQASGRPLPPLDVVPSVFFQPNFNLGDPRTFKTVTEQNSAEHDPASISYSLPLLEKFSHYADTVEQHLVREISIRSASFFAALTNLHELQSESEQCLDRISKLRALLKEVDDKSAKKGLEVVRRGGRLRNLGKVREGVTFVGGVVEMTSVAKGLVAAGQWDQALTVLTEMEHLWDGTSEPQPSSVVTSPVATAEGSINRRLPALPPTPEERPAPSPSVPPPIPLSSLTAFAALPEHLRTLTLEITSSLSTELVSVLRGDILERINSGTPSKKLHEGFTDRLRPLLQGLIRTNGIREATLSWREIALDEIRGVVATHLPGVDLTEEQTTVGGDTLRPGLANHLRNMPHAEFSVLIQSVYKSFLNAVEGLQAQCAAFVQVLETTSFQNTAALQEELTDILSSAAELSNTQAAKLILLRAEQHAILSLSEFFVFFNDSWSFVVKCEVICRQMIVGLRGVVISQSKTFLQTFHQARLTQSASLVENEQWEQVDATQPIQHITDVLVECAVKDVPELLVSAAAPSQSTTDSLAPENPSNGIPPSSPSAPPPSKKANGSSSTAKAAKIRLRIEERTYSAVAATTEVLSLLLDYLRVIVNLSMLTTDTMSRVIEFLKAFNSRTCQVVLGAGAMRSAGLKNITAKHLALASQSLSIMIALIPYVRETFRRHLSQKQAVMLVEFDKLKRDYQEHQNEIHAKLIAIMGDRLNAHIRTFQSVDWSTPREGVNSYMTVLVRETVTLHKVLSRHLSAAVVEDVMVQVFAAINHRLSEEYAKVVLPNEEARQGLLTDARFLHQKLAELKNVGKPSAMLEIVIAELRVPQPTSPAVNATNFNSAKSPATIPNAASVPTTTNSTSLPAPNPNRNSLAARLRWNSLAANAISSNATNPSVNGTNGAANSSRSSSPVTSSSTVPNVNGTSKSPPPGPLLRTSSSSSSLRTSGFRQLDPSSPRPESPLPALPPEEAEDPLGVGPATPRTPTARQSTVAVTDQPISASPERADNGISQAASSATTPQQPPP